MFKKMAIVTLLAGALAALAVTQPPGGGRRAQGGRPPGPFRGAPMMFGGGGPMMMLGLLNNPQVRQELELTEKQSTKLQQLVNQLREKFRGLGLQLRDLSPEEQAKRLETIKAEVEKELEKVLNEQQLKRFKQISLQVQGYGALAQTDVAKEVGLTEGQLKQVREILRESAEKRNAILRQGATGKPQARFQEMLKIRQWVNEQIEKLLTEQQKNKWKELIGEPFKLELQPFRGGRQQ